MERKSITLVTTSDINYDQRLQKVSKSLTNLGANVRLVGRCLKSSVELSPKAYQQKRLICIFNRGVLFYLEMNLRLFFYLLKNKSDVVCVNDVDTALVGIMLTWFRKFDLIFDAHEYFTEVPELQGKVLKKKTWAFLEKIVVQKSKACYTVNESLAKIFGKKYRKRFGVIINAPFLITKSKVEKEHYILYQGALNKGRCLEVLIKAMQQVDGQLKIAGKGDLEDELKSLVVELSLETKVEFLGNLKPEVLKTITEKAKIGLNLLEANSLNYYHSLANKFFDYMHTNTPQISMNFPEYQRINQKFEVAALIEDLNITGLSKQINKLLEDEELYLRLQSNCALAKVAFNWENEVNKLRMIYRL